MWGLKLSDCVRFRPGISEGGTGLSTGPGSWER